LDTRQRPNLSSSTLGKDCLCRVSSTRQRGCRVPDSRQILALGKDCQGPSAVDFAECQTFGTWQIFFVFCHQIFFEALLHYAGRLALGKFFLFFATKSFLKLYYTITNNMFKFRIFHCLLVYFFSLFCFIDFFRKCEFKLQVDRIIDFIHSKNFILVS